MCLEGFLQDSGGAAEGSCGASGDAAEEKNEHGFSAALGGGVLASEPSESHAQSQCVSTCRGRGLGFAGVAARMVKSCPIYTISATKGVGKW